VLDFKTRRNLSVICQRSERQEVIAFEMITFTGCRKKQSTPSEKEADWNENGKLVMKKAKE